MQLESPRAPYLQFMNPPDLYDPRLNGYSHVLATLARREDELRRADRYRDM